MASASSQDAAAVFDPLRPGQKKKLSELDGDTPKIPSECHIQRFQLVMSPKAPERR